MKSIADTASMNFIGGFRSRAVLHYRSRLGLRGKIACDAPDDSSTATAAGFSWFARVSAVAVFAASLVTPNPAAAQVVEGHCDGRPNSQVTCDTRTNMEWLDLTVTQGMSVAQVLNGDIVKQGFRYALESEIQTLWTNAGVPPPYPNETAVSGVEFLHGLMGITYSGLHGPRSQGIYNVGLHCSSYPMPRPDRACAARLARFYASTIPPDEVIPDVIADLHISEVLLNEQNQEQGSYLVRDPQQISTPKVKPVPTLRESALLLLVFALAGLTFLRLRKSQGLS